MAKFGRPYYKMVRIYDEPTDYFYVKNEGSGNLRIDLKQYNSNNLSKSLEYSYDLVTWQKVVTNDTSIARLQTSNEKIYLRSTAGTGSIYSNNYLQISPQTYVSVGGNLATLIDWQNKDGVYDLPDYSFYKIFNSNVSFYQSAENLTFGNIKNIGYMSCYQMFYQTQITALPDMSSIETISGYKGMGEMFSSCYQLTTSPDLSSLTSIGEQGLYQAFQNCSNITAQPNLSSLTTVGEQGLHQTFQSCSNLTTGADFSSVVSVDSNSGMGNLYASCYKLGTVTAPNVSTWDTSATSNWLSSAGSQATGTKTVYCPTGVTIPTGNTSGIPTDWTRVDY